MKKDKKVCAYWSSEARQKASEKTKLQFSSPEARAKQSEASKKAWADPEIRTKISAATKKALASPEIRAKISAAMTGHETSQETIDIFLSHFNQKIICLDTGAIYKNQEETARILGVAHTTIQRAIDQKRPCIAGSFARLTEYMEEQNRSRHEEVS